MLTLDTAAGRRMETLRRAGCRFIRKVHSTGVCVGLYHGVEADIDPDDPDPWRVVCEDHGSICTVSNYTLALRTCPHPEDWCEECQGKSRRICP